MSSQIALGLRALGEAGAILAAHGQLRDIAFVDRRQRLQHLQLLVAQRVGLERGGRLHRDQTKKLQHMVLHHVAQRAGFVVIGAAPADAERLGHGDLHVVDMRAVPQRLQQRVGEAQRHQVLHRLLAEIMVDAEDVLFQEHRAQRVVDRRRALPVVADRLLDDDARARRGQSLRADALGDGREQIGAGGEIIGAHALVAVHQRLELAPALLAGRVERLVADARQEFLDRLAAVGLAEFPQGVAHAVLKLGARHLAARDADDARRVGELVDLLAVIERRKQLAVGEVAGAAENDEVEGIDLDDLGSHVHLVARRRAPAFAAPARKINPPPPPP